MTGTTYDYKVTFARKSDVSGAVLVQVFTCSGEAECRKEADKAVRYDLGPDWVIVSIERV